MRTLRIEGYSQVTMAGVAAFLLACGGGDGGGPSGPAGTVLTVVEMSPASATIFNTAPGNTVALSVTPKDQSGATITSVGSRSFSSNNTAVTTVGAHGTVTAAGIGTAVVTVSVRVGEVTRTATSTVTVATPPSAAAVTAPQLAFLPPAVHITAGGTVTWNIADVPHNVMFSTIGAPANVPDLQQAAASRTFTAPGTYDYACSLHAGMTGRVHVH